MDQIDNIENPEEEIEKLEKVITQYTLVLKTSSDASQKERARAKLKSLKERRKQLLQVFDIDKNREEEKHSGEAQKPPLKYLGYILREGIERPIEDQEMNRLSLYLRFFDQEFLMIFSERKMKLDFQHSMERDSYYHRFQDALRKLNDFEGELERLDAGEQRMEEKLEIKRRTAKMKRALTVESNKIFDSVLKFTTELIADIAEDGLKCLNSTESIHFDEIEGKRYLEGKSVEEALAIIKEFTLEVIDFLNVPNFGTQEQ